MPFHSALISSLLLASAVLADNNMAFGGVSFNNLNNGTFNSITTALEVPAVTGKPQDGAIAFVSLDDTDCPTSVQLGVTFNANQYPEAPSYQAWYQIRPSGYQTISATQFPINAGDTIALEVTVHSASSVSLYFRNVNIDQTITSQPIETGHQICGRTAGWFVSSVPYEDNPSHYYDVCNFGTLKFTNATAKGPTGQIYSPKDSQNITNMSLDDGTTVAVTMVNQNSINFAYVYNEIP